MAVPTLAPCSGLEVDLQSTLQVGTMKAAHSRWHVPSLREVLAESGRHSFIGAGANSMQNAITNLIYPHSCRPEERHWRRQAA
jgi:hypothetical protein